MNAPARMGIPLRPDRGAVAADLRRSYTRSATALALSQIQSAASAEEILRANWRDDAKAGLILRGAVEPMKQAALPGRTVAALMALAPKAASIKLFEAATKIDLSGISSFSYPLASSFTEAQFIEEGMPISVGSGVFAGMPLGPVKKLALIGLLSDELENASAPTASVIIGHVLEVMIGRGLDEVLFSAAAATDAAPAGLLYGVQPITATAGGGTAAMVADLKNLATSIADANIDPGSIVIIASPKQAVALMLLSGPNFDFRIVAANITVGTVIAIAIAGLVVAGSGTPVIDVSKQGVLHAAEPAGPISTPGSPATISAPTISLFQTSTFALRCIARVCWSIAPGSISYSTGVTW